MIYHLRLRSGATAVVYGLVSLVPSRCEQLLVAVWDYSGSVKKR